jgi:hypothetical protein
MLAAAGRPAVVPAGADDRHHRRRDDHGEVKYDGGGIDTADYDGNAYDYGGGYAGDAIMGVMRPSLQWRSSSALRLERVRRAGSWKSFAPTSA